MELETTKPRHKRFCFVTYFRQRALRQLLQWLIVAAISILILGGFAVADAYAAGIVGCADLTGISATVGSGDSGSLDFDDPPTSSYRAELCSPGTFTGNNPDDFYLDGWIWDSNLGWISLSCPGGKNAKNRGLACGSRQYGVKVDLSDGGKMYGWAWGDNVGWISFGCKDGSNEEYPCGSVTYNGIADVDLSSANFGELSGYAWADSVGWFSLDNVSAKILGLVMAESDSESDWGVWTKSENGRLKEGDPGRDNVPNKKTSPVGDGSRGYDIFVHVADINGNPPNLAEITVDITTKWTDTVHWDQTGSTPEDPNYDGNNNGPVKKPLTLTSTSGKSTTGGVSGNYYGSVTSYAPTDGGNCYDETGDFYCDDAEDFVYKNFDDAAPSNTLQYDGADVTITKISTGETVNLTLPPLENPIMEFLPRVDITTFDFMKPNDKGGFDNVNYIESFRNIIDSFEVAGKTQGAAISYNVDFILDVADTVTGVTYGWIDDEEDLPAEDGSDASVSFTNITKVPSPLLALPHAPDAQLAGEIAGAKAYTLVSYDVGPNTVKYFNNGVPRREDSFIINQAAEILSGQVYSPGAAQVTDVVVTSIGDIATNRVRNQILENVSRMKAGAKVQNLKGTELRENAELAQLAGGRAFYFNNADVYIDKPGLEWAATEANKEPFTIIVEGGDIFITENVDIGIPVGFIALADFNATDELDRGGRMYVHANVTDMVDTHVYLDGPMFRYTDNICFFSGEYDIVGIYGLREPNFVKAGRCDGAAAGYKNPLATLINQFYFKGTVASQNCIGCAALTELYRGDGQLIGTPNALLYSIARLYDFNYFGYFRLDIDGVESGDRSDSLDGSQNGPVYFEYSAKPELPGF